MARHSVGWRAIRMTIHDHDDVALYVPLVHLSSVYAYGRILNAHLYRKQV